MKRTIPAVLIAAALALAGCSSTAAGQAGTAAGAALPTAAATVKAAPIVAGSDPTNSAPPSVDEKSYLDSMHYFWAEGPEDSELLSAGYYACDQLRAGVSDDQIIAVQGDRGHNADVLNVARQFLCPEFFR